MSMQGINGLEDFDLAKARHAKQAAYNEMTQAQEKMNARSLLVDDHYTEINRRQAEYDRLKKQNDEEWEKYNEAQMLLKTKIGDKIAGIKESNRLEEQFMALVNNESDDSGKKEIYLKGADFFDRLAAEKMIERDQLITKKRMMIRPDTARATNVLENLKKLRKEHGELLEDFHAAKNDFNAKKANFDRIKEKYEAIKNGKDDSTESSFSFRPKKLDNSSCERLLVEVEMPEKYRESCSISQRVDGKIDIYYGGSEEMTHGHIVIEDGEVTYRREPTPKTVA